MCECILICISINITCMSVDPSECERISLRTYVYIPSFSVYLGIWCLVWCCRQDITATCLPSRKLSKLDEPDMQDTAGRSRDGLLWTPTYGRAKAGRPARKYIQQLCEDTGWSPEDLPEAMNEWEKWRERVKDIRAGGTT